MQKFYSLSLWHCIQTLFIGSLTAEEEHLDHLAEILRRLTEADMRLKKKKCAYLLRPSIDYLGCYVSYQC